MRRALWHTIDHRKGATRQLWNDGLSVDLGLESGGWWFNVRPSNTEPLLRLNLLAQTPAEVEKHVAEVVEVMKGDA